MGDNHAEDTLQFTLSSVAEVNAYLSMINVRTGQFESGEGDWEQMDEWVEEVDSRLESAMYDWDVFKEHYDELREEGE